MYDFYAHDLELIGSSQVSDTNTNLLAYTATFGGGFSATISMEDPTYRRAPVFAQAVTGTTGLAAGVAPAAQNGVNFVSGATALAFTFNTAGVGSAVAIDAAQRNNMPDFVGALRYDGAWGSAQVSGAVHEIRTGNVVQGIAPFAVNGGVGVGTVGTGRLPQSEYGWAVQGGLKLNVPQLAPGDQIWLQGAYGQGAGQYTGINSPPGFDTQTASVTNKFNINQVDATLQANGNLNLTESWTVAAALLHYWTPEWRTAVFGTYGQANYDPRLRNGAFGPAGLTGGFGTPVNGFNTTLMSYEQFYGGSNLIWSPVRDLDIGVEVVYQRIWLPRVVADANKGGTAAIGGAGVGGTGRVTSFDDNILTRFRIQRDF